MTPRRVRVRRGVTRASSRRSEVRSRLRLSSIVFDCLRSSSIVFDRPRAPPVDEGMGFYFFIVLVLFSRCRARERSIRSRTRVRHEPRASSSPMWEKRRFVTRHLASDANARPRRRVDEKRRRETRKTRVRVSTHTFTARSSSDRASRARSEIIDRPIDRRSTRALERERFDANRTTRARVRRVSTWRTRKI